MNVNDDGVIVAGLHLHLLVTDGGFRPDGTIIGWPVHDTARLRISSEPRNEEIKHPARGCR